MASKPQQFVENVQAVLNARLHLRSAARLGPRVRLYGKPVVHNRGQLNIGNRVQLYSTVATLELAVSEGALLEIGDNVLINYGCSIGATKLVRIGNRCNVGTHVTIIDNDFHHLDPERRNEVPESAPVILEDNVWLGMRVIVLPGVTIGANSVVGAGSVVTKSIPPNVIAAGVPAKVIRSLSSDPRAEALRVN